MVKTGIDLIDENLSLFKNKRVGLVTNPTGVNSNLESTVDVMKRKTNLVALFAPEHGVRGDLQAGVHLDTYVDKATDITVYSLYGKHRHPSKEMMDLIDIMVFDIQGVGARFYTYLYTMAYVMIACKENGKKMVVLDRPNPVNADMVEGDILDINYRSFVGYYPIPQRFGLTVGELAKLFNEEFGIKCDLTVIKMSGYERKMDYRDSGLIWIMPSPNIPYVETPYYFLTTCYFEGTNLSEGRGTAKPFHLVGSPYLDNVKVVKILNESGLEGVVFRTAYFTPNFSKHQGVLCNGIEVIITDKNIFKPVKTGYTMMDVIRKVHPKELEFIPPYTEGGHPFLDLLTGNKTLREGKVSLENMLKKMEEDTEKFMKIKRRYHLYD